MYLKKFDPMKTILQQLKVTFPEVYPKILSNDRYAAYAVLHLFGEYCAQHFENDKTKEILNTINSLYQRKSHFVCNAIENEFFFEMASQLKISELNKHFQIIPENLWALYIKVLIEIQKNNQQ